MKPFIRGFSDSSLFNLRIIGIRMRLLLNGLSGCAFKKWFISFGTVVLFKVNFCLILNGQDKPKFQSLQQGLSHQLVKCILKDSRGYMWFGTQDGLNKFDGTKFVVYENDPKDTNSICHNMVNALIEDQYQNIWIGTADGLCMYSPEKDNFVHIRKLKQIRKNVKISDLFISALCAGKSRNILIGTLGYGLIDYEVKTQTLFNYFHNEANDKTIGSDYVNSILYDQQNNLWIGTRNGLNLFDYKEKTFTQFVYNPLEASGLSNNLISSLATDSKGNLWIGTIEGGLNKLYKNNNRYIIRQYPIPNNPEGIRSNYIYALCADQKGNLWIGTDNGGLNHININTGKYSFYQHEEGNPKSISANTIRSLYIDNNDILWVGTYNRGINLWDKKFEKFELYQKNISSNNTLNDNDVTGFAEDSRGNLWLTTDDGGISVYDYHKRQFVKSITKTGNNQSLSTNATLSIIHDSNENIWVGTWGGGIDRLNRDGVKIKNYSIKGFQKTGDNKISCLYEDGNNNIWAGTLGSGLFLYNAKTDNFIQVYDWEKASKLPNMAFISCILEDRSKNLWVGTYNGIINVKRINDEKFSFFVFYANNNPKNISSNRVSIIFEDSKKNLWFGTSDKGLNLFNKRDSSFTKFQKKDGLPNNSVNGVLEDNKGNLWISTNKGISEFNPSTKAFRNYTKEDGLNSNQFYLNSCLKTKTGKLFFGGNNGFNAFYPDSIKGNSYCPSVYFTDFKIFNKSAIIGAKDSPLQKHISLTNKIALTHKQTSFTIEFAALNYTRSSQNQYAYTLEGLETNWNYAGHSQAATYTFIAPGKYTFKVKGSNNDGLWNNTTTTLEIIILPPFWKTKWAYCIYIILFFSLLYVFIRLLMIRAKQAHILELNKMKIQFFANLSHELRTPLSLILSPLESLISSSPSKKDLKGKLLMINRNANRLYRLVNELMDFNKVEDNKLQIVAQPGNIVKFIREIYEFYTNEAQKKQIVYDFVADNDCIDAWFDADKLEKIILNLLSNAFKFTPEQGKISLTVEKISDNLLGEKYADVHTGFVKISIIDNGKGIPQQYLGKVFDRFFQVHDENNNHPLSGAGIGLSLTKSLVKLHHGEIFVTSEREKKTRFIVILPLGNMHFTKEEILNEPIDLVFDNAKSTLSIVPGDIKDVKIQKKAPIVLVVEDNSELREYIVSWLSGEYNLLEAIDGQMAFNLAMEHVPDLIVSDIIMPKMTGIELCKKVKEEVVTSHIPVILLTAKITLEDKIEGLQTGADAYITKPFNLRHIEATIKNLIDTRHKLFQRFSQEAYIMPKEISNNELDQKFLENIIGYIEANIANEELSVENLAYHLLMSRGHVWRKIKSLTGQTATEFIRTIRLKKSIKLIEAGELSISEIAFKVGFASPAYYTKCFKAQFGTSPSEFISNTGTRV